MFTQLLILSITTQNVAIEGHVRDARTHSALAFATVELESVRLPFEQQNTDLDGRFRFDSVAEGRYMLHVTKAGYHSSSLELDVPTTLFPINVELVQMQSTASASRGVVSIREYMIPKKARKEFDLARKQAGRQDCSKAIAHFENGLRAFDQDASVHNDLGNCYRKLGLLDRAEDSFKRATALSDSVYVALNLAEVYTAKHRYEDAENVLSEAIRRQPNSGDAYYGLAIVYFEQGLIERMEATALEAEKRPHRMPEVHLIVATIYANQNKMLEAKQQLQLYLERVPHGPRSDEVRQILNELKE